jgi:hypothetical protein
MTFEPDAIVFDRDFGAIVRDGQGRWQDLETDSMVFADDEIERMLRDGSAVVPDA